MPLRPHSKIQYGRIDAHGRRAYPQPPFQEAGGCGYARILGFRQDSTALLTHIKEHTQIPLITKLSQGDTLTGPAARMLELDLFAADLYESVITEKYKLPFINEYQQQIVRC